MLLRKCICDMRRFEKKIDNAYLRLIPLWIHFLFHIYIFTYNFIFNIQYLIYFSLSLYIYINIYMYAKYFIIIYLKLRKSDASNTYLNIAVFQFFLHASHIVFVCVCFLHSKSIISMACLKANFLKYIFTISNKSALYMLSTFCRSQDIKWWIPICASVADNYNYKENL